MAGKFLDNFAQRFQRHAPKPPPAAPKTTFGVGAIIAHRYRLDAELGRGGMGVVYRAHDLAQDCDVAFKIINVAEAGAGARAQFLREAQITAQLAHPHIVAVHEIGAADIGAGAPAPFIVMELLAGKPLSEWRGLTFAQIVDIARQVCAALAYAHAQNLVHRDLKPENVLVEKRGRAYSAKLLDFGLARPRGDPNIPAEKEVAGTVYYVAPEVIAGKPTDASADLYALGVMLYELVTGRVPFSDFDSQSILAQHLKESVVPPSQTRRDVPPLLESIILRLLAKEPRDRFASAHDVDRALAQVIAAPPRIAARCHTHAPQFATRLIGRTAEIAQLRAHLETQRLITLTGADGIGKTRLALATVQESLEQFADGVWWVELAGWRDPALVAQRVAATLGVPEEARRALAVSLAENLREKNLLLVLDACDHVTGACARLAETLLRGCPQVSILATSARPLNLAAEHVFAVPGLARADAAQLFRERVIAANPSTPLDETNLGLITQVGERFAAAPLALELIAARARTASLAQISATLPAPGDPAQTLAAVLETQCARLAPSAQRLLQCLSIFADGGSFDALEAFCGTGTLDTTRDVAQLHALALVTIYSARAGELRYRLPEPIRQFAFAQLQAADTEDTARRNHRAGYLAHARNAARQFHTAEQNIWRARLESEIANVIAALDWTLAQRETNLALQFGAALWQFWRAHNYWRDGADRLAKMLALPHTPADAPARANVLIGAGYLALLQMDFAAAQRWFEQGLETAHAHNLAPSIANALCGLGALAQARGDYARAETLYRDGWEQYQRVGDAWETAHARFNLGLLKLRQGDPLGARTLLRASVDELRAIGATRAAAQAASHLGSIAQARQEWADAAQWFEQSLAGWRSAADELGVAQQLANLGFVALHQARFEFAQRAFDELLRAPIVAHHRRLGADALCGYAGVLAAQRQPERAAQLFGAAEALRQPPGARADATPAERAQVDWVRARIDLDPEKFAAACATGKTLSLDQARALAAEMQNLPEAHRAVGQV